MTAQEKTKRNYGKEAADKVIKQITDALASGAPLPFNDPMMRVRHFNPVSGTVYQGINRFLLHAALPQGSADPRWMTFKQMEALQQKNPAIRLKKNAKSAMVVFSKPIIIKEPQAGYSNDSKGASLADAPMIERKVFVLKGYLVFNGSQISGLPPLVHPQHSATHDGEHIFNLGNAIASEAGVREQIVPGVAAYAPVADVVKMPPPEHFKSLEDYTAVRMHEISHWTGHASRLNRNLLNGAFGSPEYAREELRAEIASAILGGLIGYNNDLSNHITDHAAYIQSWLSALQKDHREIFKAANQAEQIVGYLGELSPTLAHLMAAENQFVQQNIFTAETFSAEQEKELGDSVASQAGVEAAAQPVQAVPEVRAAAVEQASPSLGQEKPAQNVVGVNHLGEELFEGEAGVRSKNSRGFLSAEPIPIIPGKFGAPDVPNRSAEWLTVHELAARRNALMTDVSLLSSAELMPILAGEYEVEAISDETDTEIHRQFAEWVAGSIEGGAFDKPALTGADLFRKFLKEQSQVVEPLLAADEERRRMDRVNSAIDAEATDTAVAEPAASIGGPAEPEASSSFADRTISIQPFRDEKGGWLKVSHQDFIDLGLADKISGEDSRMTPGGIYLAFNETDPGCDAQRLVEAVEAAGWVVDFQQYVESRESQIRSYAAYFAPLVGYLPKVGDRLKLVEGVARIESKSPNGSWLAIFEGEKGKQRALSSGRFYDFIENVVEGDFIKKAPASPIAEEEQKAVSLPPAQVEEPPKPKAKGRLESVVSGF
ncbi:ArdC family protein [Vogesella sp. XCS3]|uniref:ArdC family protein n=1 Tax=Vogesella sp. XCS3 TaxID=2877939 RepID=UPI001D0B6228|nr:zincin-like metallopeptidase domain-containing protein [Vogesella sp. XCS3]UDM18843.1 ssDNA-binding domain-containing protein [Vogesella sp. XCS3]